VKPAAWRNLYSVALRRPIFSSLVALVAAAAVCRGGGSLGTGGVCNAWGGCSGREWRRALSKRRGSTGDEAMAEEENGVR